MAKRIVGVRVEDEFWDELSKFAFLAGKSRSEAIREGLEMWMEKAPSLPGFKENLEWVQSKGVRDLKALNGNVAFMEDENLKEG
jgi:hypothetical protein